MKRGHALLALTLAAAPAPARAQTIDRSNGEAGAPILQLTTTPRAAALGGALAAASTRWCATPAAAAARPRDSASRRTSRPSRWRAPWSWDAPAWARL